MLQSQSAWFVHARSSCCDYKLYNYIHASLDQQGSYAGPIFPVRHEDNLSDIESAHYSGNCDSQLVRTASDVIPSEDNVLQKSISKGG